MEQTGGLPVGRVVLEDKDIAALADRFGITRTTEFAEAVQALAEFAAGTFLSRKIRQQDRRAILAELKDRPLSEMWVLLPGALANKRRPRARINAVAKADFYRLVVNSWSQFGLDDTLPQTDYLTRDSATDAVHDQAKYPLFVFTIELLNLVEDAGQPHNLVEGQSLRSIFDGLTAAKKAQKKYT
jgi:hypothetical protein